MSGYLGVLKPAPGSNKKVCYLPHTCQSVKCLRAANDRRNDLGGVILQERETLAVEVKKVKSRDLMEMYIQDLKAGRHH